MEDLDKFEDRTGSTFALAQAVAGRYRSEEVQPEHVFLSMLEAGDGVHIAVLRSCGADPLHLKAALESRLTRGAEEVTAAVVSAATHKLIANAVVQARGLNHGYVGKEHLLLALIADAGPAGAVLRENGVTSEVAKQGVVSVLAKSTRRFFIGSAADSEVPRGLKRYNLALPEDLFREVEQLAQRQNTTVVEVLRRFVKLGLYVTAVQESPGGAILVREGDREREIVIL